MTGHIETVDQIEGVRVHTNRPQKESEERSAQPTEPNRKGE